NTRSALPARTSTQLVLPPKPTVSGPGVGMLPRTPQKVICILLRAPEVLPGVSPLSSRRARVGLQWPPRTRPIRPRLGGGRLVLGEPSSSKHLVEASSSKQQASESRLLLGRTPPTTFRNYSVRRVP